MSHHQDLAVNAQLFHEPANRFGHSTTHTRVNLVKNQGASFAKLAGGVCVIRVGAATEVELNEKMWAIGEEFAQGLISRN